MGKKTLKEKTDIEQHYDKVKSKITGLEKDRKAGSQIGPWIVLLLGALVTTVGLYSGIFSDRFIGFIVGIIGVLIIVAAWIWSKRRSIGDGNVEDKILNLKGELSRLEKER